MNGLKWDKLPVEQNHAGGFCLTIYEAPFSLEDISNPYVTTSLP